MILSALQSISLVIAMPPEKAIPPACAPGLGGVASEVRVVRQAERAERVAPAAHAKTKVVGLVIELVPITDARFSVVMQVQNPRRDEYAFEVDSSNPGFDILNAARADGGTLVLATFENDARRSSRFLGAGVFKPHP